MNITNTNKLEVNDALVKLAYSQPELAKMLDFKLAVDTVYGVKKEEKMNRQQIEALAREAAKQLIRIENIEKKYGKDEDYQNGSAFYVDLKFDGSKTIYHYLFTKGNGFWYSTAVATTCFKRGTFDQLIDWLESPSITIVKMGLLKRVKPFIKNGELV